MMIRDSGLLFGPPCIFERISVVVQSFNSILLRDGFVYVDRPDRERCITQLSFLPTDF